MKQSLLLLPLLCSVTAFAQNSVKFHHNLTQANVTAARFQIRTDDVANTLMTIGGGEKLKCIITSDGKGKISVDFWQIVNTLAKPDPYLGNPTVLNSTTTTTKFVLTDNRGSLGNPTRVLKVPFQALTFSVGTTPLRVRPKTDSSAAIVSAALGLSFSPGYTWGYSVVTGRGLNSYSFTVGPFVGVSTAELKKETVKTPRNWEVDKISNRVLPTFSYGVSTTFARNNFGVVISGGFDLAIGDMADAWSYQNKLWIGLGINTNLGIFK